MFIKSIISFILAPFILIGQIFGPKEVVYIAPTPSETISTTTTQIVETEKATSTEKTTVKPKVVATTTVKTKPIEKIEVPKAPIVPEAPPNFEVINNFARGTTVNIFCTTKSSSVSPISGTGAIVSPKGLILTNAHIAQYFLLKDLHQKDFIQCMARTGSPATEKYSLELVYISPTWVTENKTTLKDENPKGTGENDFAFLRITGTLDGSKLPDTFSYVTMNVRENIALNEPVLLVAYPAGFLGGTSIIQNLNIASSITNIQNIFTFKKGLNDILAVGGTVLSQKGSSGGLVVDKYSSLIGIISTSTNAPTTSGRELNAITLAHINRSMLDEINTTLSQFMDQDHSEFAKTFNKTTGPTLTKVLENILK